MTTDFDITFKVVSLILVYFNINCACNFSSVICSRLILCEFAVREIGTYFLCLTTTLHARRVSLIHVTLLPHSGEIIECSAIYNLTNIFMCVFAKLLIE